MADFFFTTRRRSSYSCDTFSKRKKYSKIFENFSEIKKMSQTIFRLMSKQIIAITQKILSSPSDAAHNRLYKSVWNLCNNVGLEVV